MPPEDGLMIEPKVIDLAPARDWVPSFFLIKVTTWPLMLGALKVPSMPVKELTVAEATLNPDGNVMMILPSAGIG